MLATLVEDVFMMKMVIIMIMMYLVKATFYTLEFVEASCLVGVR